VDLAEKMQRPAKKLEQILKGQVYNMQARNYFAVVTGTDSPDASIEEVSRMNDADVLLRPLHASWPQPCPLSRGAELLLSHGLSLHLEEDSAHAMLLSGGAL
jgi:hypothetical protein